MKIYFDYMSNSLKHGAHHKNILSNFPRPFHSHLVVISTHFIPPLPAWLRVFAFSVLCYVDLYPLSYSASLPFHNFVFPGYRQLRANFDIQPSKPILSEIHKVKE